MLYISFLGVKEVFSASMESFKSSFTLLSPSHRWKNPAFGGNAKQRCGNRMSTTGGSKPMVMMPDWCGTGLLGMIAPAFASLHRKGSTSPQRRRSRDHLPKWREDQRTAGNVNWQNFMGLQEFFGCLRRSV